MGALNTDRVWWNAKDRRVSRAPHETLISTVQEMQRQQSGRYRVMRRLIALYEYGVGASLDPNRNAKRLNEDDLYFNMAQNGIDTVHAQICTPRVAPMPLTSGGTWTSRQAAKEMGRGLEAEFDENTFDETTESVVLDGLLVGTGIAKTFEEWGRCKIERVNPTSIYVDEAETRDGAPRCIYERRCIDKYKAVELYGGPEGWLFGSSAGREKAILQAPAPKYEDDPLAKDGQVELWEAYHLPSGPGAKDGRIGLCVEGATLIWLPFEEDEFPYTTYTPKRPREGWWGLSTMRNYAAAQKEFEKMGRKIQRMVQQTGTHILAHKNSKVTPRSIDNGSRTLVEWEGQNEPKEWNPEPTNPQHIEWWQMLGRMALQNDGTSEFAAQSQVPAGLAQASGKALQKFDDIDNKRKISHFRARERFVIATSKAVVRTWKKLIAADPEYSVRYVDKHSFDRIRIADALVDDCVIRIFPVGALSQDPSAKFAQLDALLDRGAITIEQFKRLYEIPDIEAENDLDAATVDIVDRNLDYILCKGKPMTAEPFDDENVIIVRGGKFYNHARRIEVPEARLELIRQYIASAVSQQKKKKAAAAADAAALAPAAPPQGAPPGLPAPAPAGAAPMM
jgi:hypothetical protein